MKIGTFFSPLPFPSLPYTHTLFFSPPKKGEFHVIMSPWCKKLNKNKRFEGDMKKIVHVTLMSSCHPTFVIWAFCV